MQYVMLCICNRLFYYSVCYFCFNTEDEIVTVMEKISTPRRRLLGQIVLKVSRLSPIDGILVSNIKDDRCKEEFLKFYFAKPKQSGGKNVKDAKVIARGKATVTFEDPEGDFLS